MPWSKSLARRETEEIRIHLPAEAVQLEPISIPTRADGRVLAHEAISVFCQRLDEYAHLLVCGLIQDASEGWRYSCGPPTMLEVTPVAEALSVVEGGEECHDVRVCAGCL